MNPWMAYKLVAVSFAILFCNYVAGQQNITNLQFPATGGTVARLGELPHAILVMTKTGKCTGALIHEAWVLTAAHCVSRDGYTLANEEIMVIAGVIDFKDPGPSAQKRVSIQTVVHSNYKNARLAKYDLALVKVEPFQLNTMVSVIQFSRKEWPQDQRMLNRNCTSAGWGMLPGRQSTSVLHLQRTTARHGVTSCPCIEKGYMLKRTVCLAAEPKIGICFGDSGGALVCDNEIVGVAHMVMDRRSCSYFKAPENTLKCESSYVFGIYMYTCPYLDWIKRYVPGVPPTPVSCKAPHILSPLKLFWMIVVAVVLVRYMN